MRSGTPASLAASSTVSLELPDTVSGSFPLDWFLPSPLSIPLSARSLLNAWPQRAMVALEALPWLEKEAKERMKEGGKTAGRERPKEKGVARLPHPNSASVSANGKARNEAAKQARCSARYVSDAKRIKAEKAVDTKCPQTGELTRRVAERPVARGDDDERHRSNGYIPPASGR
jgi:hypothetical protein